MYDSSLLHVAAKRLEIQYNLALLLSDVVVINPVNLGAHPSPGAPGLVIITEDTIRAYPDRFGLGAVDAAEYLAAFAEGIPAATPDVPREYADAFDKYVGQLTIVEERMGNTVVPYAVDAIKPSPFLDRLKKDQQGNPLETIAQASTRLSRVLSGEKTRLERFTCIQYR